MSVHTTTCHICARHSQARFPLGEPKLSSFRYPDESTSLKLGYREDSLWVFVPIGAAHHCELIPATE
jgi:hypothetical protein